MTGVDDIGNRVASAVLALGRVWPVEVAGDPDLDAALGFLGWSVDASDVERSAYVAAIGVGLLASIATLAPGGTARSVVGGLLCVASLGIGIGGPAVPRLLARARRSRALGAAPALVTRATLRMRLSPAPERAAAFAAESGESVLADSLAGHVRRSRGAPRTGLAAFGSEWEAWFPELERACSLLESAGRAASGRRDRSLDRARRVVLDGARDRLSAFGASIRGPVTALYAFGVLLPLALASLLPAVRAAGLPASLAAFVVLYDVVLPTATLGACVWLLARRPVAFPPPPVDRSHPDVDARGWVPAVAGAAGATLSWHLAGRWLPNWTSPLAALGCGVGLALVAAYRPTTAVRAEVREVEAGLSDALSLLGRRVQRGESVERALPAVADELVGPTGDLLAEAADRQRRLGVGIEAALDDASADVPSRRVAGAVATISLAASEGRPAGEALVAMGDHFEEIAAVERETRRSVEQVTSTLSNTAAVFGPLVGGATVALAGALGGEGPLVAAGGGGGLGTAVGTYVLLLAALLTALATGLTRGFDRALVGYRIGLALVAATVTFLAALAGAALTV